MAVLILINSKKPTYSQHIACRTEAERLNKYINHQSPILTTKYYLSFFKASRLEANDWKSSSAEITHKRQTHSVLIVFVVFLYIFMIPR